MTAMRTAAVTLALVALAALSGFAADPGLLNLVMPDARLVAGINVDQSKNSPLGQYLLSRMEADDEDFQKFVAMTGFDPRRDLREVLVATRGGSVHGGLAAGRGVFDPPRILGLARSHGAQTTTYQGVDVICSPKGSSGCLAFLNGSLAVAGNSEDIHGAIDRWRGRGARLDAALAAKVQTVSSLQDVWLVSIGSPAQLAGRVPDPNIGGAMKGDVMQAIEEMSGGVKFGTSVRISGEAVTRSERDATALTDVIRFLAGLIQLSQPPEAAAITGEILNTMQLTAQGNTVKVSVSIPEEQFEKLIPPPPGKRPRARKTGSI